MGKLPHQCEGWSVQPCNCYGRTNLCYERVKNFENPCIFAQIQSIACPLPFSLWFLMSPARLRCWTFIFIARTSSLPWGEHIYIIAASPALLEKQLISALQVQLLHILYLLINLTSLTSFYWLYGKPSWAYPTVKILEIVRFWIANKNYFFNRLQTLR